MKLMTQRSLNVLDLLTDSRQLRYNLETEIDEMTLNVAQGHW